MECFAKIVNNFYKLTVFTKCSILDILQGSEYVPDCFKYCNSKDLVVYLSIILFPKISSIRAETAIDMHLSMVAPARDQKYVIGFP